MKILIDNIDSSKFWIFRHEVTARAHVRYSDVFCIKSWRERRASALSDIITDLYFPNTSWEIHSYM